MDFIPALSAVRIFVGNPGGLRPFGVQRVRPAVRFVLQVTQAVESSLIPRWRNVQALAGRKLHTRRAEVKFYPALMAVSYPENVVLIGFETGEGKVLEGIHDFRLLSLIGSIVSRETDHSGTIGPLMRAAIDQRLRAGRVTTQHVRWRVAGDHDGCTARVSKLIALVVIGNDLSCDQVFDRPGTTALSIGKELDQHRGVLAISVAS